MTIRFDILTISDFVSGWVQVDPIDYEYTGPDPDGEIEAYLSDLKSGEISFSLPTEYDEDDVVEPDEKIMRIKGHLTNFDPIWTLDVPDDFVVTSLGYDK